MTDQTRQRREQRVAPGRVGDRSGRAASTLERLAGEQRLPGWVHARFRQRLTVEDAEDVAAEAFAQAVGHLRRGSLPTARGEVDLWLKKAAYHRAIDLLRARDGQSSRVRPAIVPLHLVAEEDLPLEAGVDDDDATYEAVQHAAERDERVRAVRAALAELSPRERRVLVLRHYAGLPVSVCARRLGMSASKFERIHTAAMKRLAARLASQVPSRECLRVRRGLALAYAQLDEQGLTKWSAHLELCLPCATEAARLGQPGRLAA